MARRGLGRGLDALIPDRTEDRPSGNAVKNGSDTSDSEKKRTDDHNKKAGEGKKAGESTKSGSKKKTKAIKSTDRASASNESAEQKNSASAKEKTNPSIRSNAEEKTGKEAQNIQGEVVSVRIGLVEPNRGQPRKYFDDTAINELADSIKQFGVIQPLLVQEKDGYYEIIAGERRWRAAQKAGLKEVPVIIRRFSSQEAVEVALIENIQREDLNPMEEARAYERLVKEYGLSQEDVAGRVSKSRSAITNSMRLLRLDESVQKMVETSQISEGHARALLGLASADAQKKAAEQVVEDRLSVRQTEKLVREANKPVREKKKTVKESDPVIQGLAGNMTTVLGTKVSIRSYGRDKGRIEIEYYSAEDLDRIYELLLSVH